MFNFTRGERIAAIILLLIIIIQLLFSTFYEARSSKNADLNEFKELITQFEIRQLFLEDSIENARKEYYANRYQQNRRESYSYDSSRNRNNAPFEKQEKKPQYAIIKLELNKCDTSEIVVVPQFGSKRAQKLVEYREKLGGFYAFEQVKEIYILQNIEVDFLKKYFTLDVSLIHKININSATYRELVTHPYIDAYLAKLIINYREKNGNFTSMEEVQKATNAYRELIEKLQHYIEF
ncbi:MAG: helix-hairpin-helix domain-containing protein [Bacteroidetes bacterium]|nr:helix-hairpin-helix domain-containing protein [Bacteroidota bacterium]MCL2302145.1 helix-hairpin-helix domain-containing protein [Lentimicrobiaceae bacterium]